MTSSKMSVVNWESELCRCKYEYATQEPKKETYGIVN